VFISVREADKPATVDVAKNLHNLGFTILATRGTASLISAAGVPVTIVNKVAEGRPHIVDMIKNGEIRLIINTVDSKPSVMRDSYSIRHAALARTSDLLHDDCGCACSLYGDATFGGVAGL
jgi:carbamoyl-phosphate synthase large subunit